MKHVMYLNQDFFSSNSKTYNSDYYIFQLLIIYRSRYDTFSNKKMLIHWIFLISPQKHMLWIIIRSALSRHF